MKEYSLELYHHGVKGMKWGVRRYQNKDGTLTSKGKMRLKSYREHELDGLDRKYSRISKIDAKIEKKQAKQEENPTERRAKKIDKLKFQSLLLAGLKAAEDKALRSMSLKQLLAEKRAVNGRHIAGMATSLIATTALTAIAPYRIGVAHVTDIDAYKTSLRVDKDAQAAIVDRASKQLEKEKRNR